MSQLNTYYAFGYLQELAHQICLADKGRLDERISHLRMVLSEIDIRGTSAQAMGEESVTFNFTKK